MGAGSFLASFTGPEGPSNKTRQSAPHQRSTKDGAAIRSPERTRRGDGDEVNQKEWQLRKDWNDAQQRETKIKKLTLGLGEVTLLDTGLDGLVEHAIKGSLSSRRDLVVGLNIFLDGLAAVTSVSFET